MTSDRTTLQLDGSPWSTHAWVVKLWRSPLLPSIWIGEDLQGALVQWPAERRGWQRRTVYAGQRRVLVAVDPAEARGSGWPGGGRGKLPRAGGRASRPFTIKVADEERAAWESAAGARPVSEWARDELNAAATRKSKG